MHLPEVKTLHDEATATGDGTVLNDTAWRLNDRQRRDEVTLEVVVEDTVTSFSIQPKQSNDGTTWYDLGDAIAAAGVHTVSGIKMPFFKAEIDAITNVDGSVTVRAS